MERNEDMCSKKGTHYSRTPIHIMERNEEKVLQKAHTLLPHTYPHRGKERKGGGDETGITTLLYYI
jgi:hypothetical protein